MNLRTLLNFRFLSSETLTSNWSTFWEHDVPVTGENGRLEYAIASGDDEGVFDIGKDNGTIMTRKQLDRETRSLYNLVVVATDQAKAPQQRLSSTVQVSR